MLVVIEISSIFLAKHYSQTYARVSRQYAEAVKIRPAPSGEPTSVLMVGNSFLLRGLDVDRLRDLTSRTLRIYPIFLEGTGYYDWLYGLRHLFRDGARPQVVVIGLEVNTSLENGVWDESPKMILAARDVVGVASDLGLDRTATSDLLLAHYSTFWEKRSFIRRQILVRTVPHFDELFPFIRFHPQDVEFESIAMPRLRNLRELCEAHGAKLILLIPPTPSSEGAVHRMAIASQKVGVEALVPIDPSALSAKFYQRDAIHLNSEGAARFTSAVANDLPNVVSRETLASPD
jgi:hypothetical protein